MAIKKGKTTSLFSPLFFVLLDPASGMENKSGSGVHISDP
jgi:hypothetical protein